MLEHSRAAGGSGGGVELLSNGSGLQHWESFNIAFMAAQQNGTASEILVVRMLHSLAGFRGQMPNPWHQLDAVRFSNLGAYKLIKVLTVRSPVFRWLYRP